MKRTVFYNSGFMDLNQVQVSPDDRGFLFADGVYEVIRYYGSDFFNLGQHIHRLKRSCHALTHPADNLILPGITRADIIKVITGMGYTLVEKAINVNELKEYDEFFFDGHCHGSRAGAFN